MSNVLGACLPEELLQAILIRLDDGSEYALPFKRGLTSCSLTCRHWAKAIRPILFRRLTLRTAQDVDEFVCLLKKPDFLDTPIATCVTIVDLDQDLSFASVSWGHLFFLRTLPRLSTPVVSWTIRDLSVLDGRPVPNQRCPLPFAGLPRSLPAPTRLLHKVVLSGLLLPSVRELERFARNIIFERLELRSVAFANITHAFNVTPVQLAPRRLPKSRYLAFTFEHCIGEPGSAPMLFWVQLCTLLFACQRLPLVDDGRTAALLMAHLQLFTANNPSQSGSWVLEANYEWQKALPKHHVLHEEYHKYYLYGTATFPKPLSVKIAMAYTRDGFPRSGIHEAKFVCPDTTEAEITASLSRVENEFLSINGFNIPILWIRCPRGTAESVLDGILEGHILAVLSLRSRAVFLDVSGAVKYFSVEEVVGAPTSVERADGDPVPLNTAQRRQWLLRGWPDERSAYLDEVRRSTSASVAMVSSHVADAL